MTMTQTGTSKHAHEGVSCWTPKLCAALSAVAELRTLAVREDDHELSVRLDTIEATLKGDLVKCADSGTQVMTPTKAGDTASCGNCGATVSVLEVPLRPADPDDHNTLRIVADHWVPR